MPFLDHLEELRWRIIYSLGALLVGIAVGFVVAWKYKLLQVVSQPILPFLQDGQHLSYTHPAAPMTVYLQLAFAVGIAVALPVILYQVWAFLSPALLTHERRTGILVLFAATVLFLMGGSLAYFLVLPWSLKFFFLVVPGAESMTAMIMVNDYIGFVTNLVLLFGACFEVPIIIVALSAFGVVSTAATTKITTMT
jgi:sec-independent protein translocase protein TatC